MTATNHTLTGVVAGLVIHAPIVALPLAFGLHFVLDALPHYGNENHTANSFKNILALDMLLALMILVLLIATQPTYWLLAVACGIACASPDLMWFPNWLRELSGKKKKVLNIFERFHSRIQKHEKPHNWSYEVIWLFVGMAVLAKLLNFE